MGKATLADYFDPEPERPPTPRPPSAAELRKAEEEARFRRQFDINGWLDTDGPQTAKQVADLRQVIRNVRKDSHNTIIGDYEGSFVSFGRNSNKRFISIKGPSGRTLYISSESEKALGYFRQRLKQRANLISWKS